MTHVMIPRINAQDRERSLGWLALWWIEQFTVLGAGGHENLSVEETPEYAQFIVNCYTLDQQGKRRFNHVFLSRPKGCDKSGKAAKLALFEAFGPCRFDHWAQEGEYYEFMGLRYDYMAGEPVGRPVQNPNIAVCATSEDQTDNVYARVLYNCMSGPLSALKPMGLDPANSRILLPDGGWVKPYSINAGSKDGGLETFACFDETHLYRTPQLHAMYSTVVRNLAKRKLDAEPWYLETTTMFRPGEGSVAEGTFQNAWDVKTGRIKHGSKGIYFDHRYASLPAAQFADESKTLLKLAEAYGSAAHASDGKEHVFQPDGALKPIDADGKTLDGYTLRDEGVEPGPSPNGWVDLTAQYENLILPTSDPGDSIRYFLNNLASQSNAWLDEAWIEAHTVMSDKYITADGVRDYADTWQQVIKPTDEITLGFDGSVSDDSTALVGCRVRDGLLFLIKLDQAPDGPEKATWRVDRDAFDGKVRYMFNHYNVVGMFADPAFFESMISGWEADFDGMLKVSPKSRGDKIKFFMSTWNQDVYKALQAMRTSFQYEMKTVPEGASPLLGNIMLLGDPRLVNHFRNARIHDRSFGYLVFKENPNSPKKIDAMMAGLLAYRAREAYLTLAKPDVKPTFIPVRVR